jgi:hypothetical protein
MADRHIQAETSAQGEEHLRSLYSQALGGNPEARDELSKIALGGFRLARQLIQQLEEAQHNPTSPQPALA